jgi:hypothetical protein
MFNNNVESLDEEQERTLSAVLNLIIPPSEDGKMPGAVDVNFFAYMHHANLLPLIREGLINIVEESHNKYGQEFGLLSSDEQEQLIDGLRRRYFRFFGSLTNGVVQCYYLHDQVLKGIGVDVRPPFPQGYLVEEGDLCLLESVYERGQIYRDC